MRRSTLEKEAGEILDRFGLSARLKHKPAELSGGERQRVALARALMNKPALLLADEPTGNLDAVTGGQILDVIAQAHREGQTIVMVTHDQAIADRADRVLNLVDGIL
jgi:predicted ABC-type transport system involved in lysophospholipase L1 biosynthesis ATPase subunit